VNRANCLDGAREFQVKIQVTLFSTVLFLCLKCVALMHDIVLFSVASDVWSFGVLVWEIVTNGSVPYGEENLVDVIVQIRDQFKTLKIPNDCHSVFRALMKKCFQPDPNERITIEQVVEYLKDNQIKENDL